MLAKCVIFCLGLTLQYLLVSASDSCQKKNTCQECISDPSVCVWCAENDFNHTRCIPLSSVEDNWCPKGLQYPNNAIQTSESKEFSSVLEHVIQIKPQRYKLKLRQGMPQSFNFSFQGAQNYPVDLYFLLDASKTMKNIKENTASQSREIYFAIKNMTSNVHLGFGTFIDKGMLPIMSNKKSDLTYSFKHHLKLGDNYTKFQKEVSEAPSGGSRDPQEGGLDALAQVLVCKDIIGWRNESRKIVVFLTDGPYHAAGDGKAAGLFEPYDGQCYTENGTYTKEREMDYPSVGMISKLAAERDIIVIFLVDTKVSSIYDNLKRSVTGSQVTIFNRDKKKLQSDDLIVQLLKKNYEDISNKIKLIAKVKSGSRKNFKISFEPDCTTGNKNTACNVEIGKEQHIVGTVQYDATEDAIVDIIVEGIGEKLTLEIETIKNCDCERDVELNSTYCYEDKRMCGICSCSENRYGERCMCVKSEKNGFKDNSTCIAEGSKVVCNDHGTCFCGTCQCTGRYTGKFCQCNMDSCPRSSLSSPESVCGGKDHGECDCGKCKCKADWTGDACDCYKPDTYCKEEHSTSVCNNRGQCVCGECRCEKMADWDARNSQTEKCHINPCLDCHERQCTKLEKCAKCRRSHQEPCGDCDDRIAVQIVETLTKEHINSSQWKVCNMKVKIGCQTSFVYRYNDTDYSVEVVVANDEDCAPNYYIFGGIFLLTLLLVGAGTLIAWKLLTDARDRQEYMKFMRQNDMGGSGPVNNVLYESPTTTINNPTFRKRSVKE